MKRILFAILGTALLFSACSKGNLTEPMEQNPYRAIIEYTPGSFKMDVPGALTPVENYDWITVSQSGSTATFTVRRNTTGLIRRAEFTIAGEKKICAVNQKEHGLDATVEAALAGQSKGSVTIECAAASKFADDYESWGIAYGKTTNLADAKEAPQSGSPVGGRLSADVTGLEDGADYYAWTYVVSTEGDKVYSGMLAILPPTYVKAGEDIQAAIDAAKPYSTVMVQGGWTYTAPKGGIKMGDGNVNKSVSGGWNADFSEQSMDNLTVIDGNKGIGFFCANSDGAMDGSANISYFEIKNCGGDHGTAVHCIGGPVTVSNCYVHDNDSEKGAIGTNEGGYATTLTVVNCIVSNNGANAHGPAFGFGEGKSDTEPVVATLVNNLIIDNVSTKKDGYASTFICYNQTRLVLVNNTVVGNKNWAEYGGPYSGMVLRGDVASCFVNNIMVGNFTSPCTKEMENPEYERQNEFLNMGGGAGTLANNMIEGAIRESSNITIADQINMDLGFDLSTVLTADYKPLGKALGAGTLGTVTYNSKKAAMNGPFSVDIKALLDKYKVDLAGNPRITNGKVDLGCYQAQ